MVDLQWLMFSLLSFPAEALLHSNYLLCFCFTVTGAGVLISPAAAASVFAGALFALLASYGRGPGPVPRYAGPVDVLLGRSYRASTLTPAMPANNNVSIAAFGGAGKLVIAYRKAESHFASRSAKIIVATSTVEDLDNWKQVWQHHTGTDDLREMILFPLKDKLFLYYTCLAPIKRGFTPRRMQWACAGEDLSIWTTPVDVGRPSEIAWDVKVHEDPNGQQIAYKASYTGNHYAAGAVCTVLFEQSCDGVQWRPVGKESAVYEGGVCEVSFAFTARGDLAAVGRNEDGDRTGFGAQLFFAPAGDLGSWMPLKLSMPYRFDSPRLVSMEGELVLFARYAKERYTAVPQWLPFALQRFGNLIIYSVLPKGAAVYRLRQPDEPGGWAAPQPLELIRFFEETHGDTGFFSLAQAGKSGEWVVANYASSCHSHAPWIYGQVFATDVYVCRCHPLRTG